MEVTIDYLFNNINILFDLNNYNDMFIKTLKRKPYCGSDIKDIVDVNAFQHTIAKALNVQSKHHNYSRIYILPKYEFIKRVLCYYSDIKKDTKIRIPEIDNIDIPKLKSFCISIINKYFYGTYDDLYFNLHPEFVGIDDDLKDTIKQLGNISAYNYTKTDEYIEYNKFVSYVIKCLRDCCDKPYKTKEITRKLNYGLHYDYSALNNLLTTIDNDYWGGVSQLFYMVDKRLNFCTSSDEMHLILGTQDKHDSMFKKFEIEFLNKPE